MEKIRFYLAKYTSILILLILYFFMIHFLMTELDAFFAFLPDSEMNKNFIIVFCGVYCGLYMYMLYSFEALMIGHRRILDLSFGHFITAVLVNLLLILYIWLLRKLEIGQALLLFVALVSIECLCGLGWIIMNHRLYERYHFVKEALFIHGERENLKEYQHMNNTVTRYFKFSQEVKFTVGREQLFQYVDKAEIVFLGDIPTQLRNELLKVCMQLQKECYCMPKVSDVYIQSAAVRQLHDKLLLEFPNMGVPDDMKCSKRMMDILVAVLLLIVTAPIMLIIAIGIKLEDGGSIIYRQVRITEGGREFQMLKFRSMRENAETEGMTLAKKQDSRVTRIGRIIRNIHFDELPQLINVLRGDMSIVGPRPERKEFIEEYATVIPEFTERLKVKGGLTGYAQVYGKYNTEPEDKIKYDLYYIYNYSLWLDIKILFLTVRILFQPENTQGIDEEQTSAIKKR